MEIWKDVPGYPGVKASSWGRIICRPDGKPTFGSISKADQAGTYFRMRVRINRKTVKAHILVCLAFRGQKPFQNSVVLHGDDNGLNNREENLSWGDQLQNMNTPRMIALLSEKAKWQERKGGKFV